MKRSLLAVTTLSVTLAFAGSASAINWGGIKAWVKRSIAEVTAEIKDPKVKAAVEDLRQSVNGLKGKLKGLYPQYRALVGYFAVAAAKSEAGKLSADDVQAFVAKVKESATKIGEGGLKAVRDWVKENSGKFATAGKAFKVAFKKIRGQFKHKVLGWWKKMAAQMKQVAGGAEKPAPAKAAAKE